MTPFLPNPSRTKRLSFHLLPNTLFSTIQLCLLFVLLHHHHPSNPAPHYRLWVPSTQAFQITTYPAFALKKQRRITTPQEWYCDTTTTRSVTPLRTSVEDIRDNTATATIEPPVPLSSSSSSSSSELLIVSTDSTSSPTAQTNGAPSNSTSTSTSTPTNPTPEPNDAENDTPTPTENGGYTHTKSSRAKISAANKGKVPWNKGRTRSPEEKARISAGVRKKNRERHLQKLADLGYTEEEWEAKKKEERRAKDAERRMRRTEKGGYRPTKETKEKISKILKEKHKKGEIKKRVYNGPFRKGFKHSEETKEKIRASLRKKWAEDEDYQEKMRGANARVNSASVRDKISKTLKEKWQDPEFREKMLVSIKTRKPTSGNNNGDTRLRSEKISETMKRKWLDMDYRKKAMEGMAKHRNSLPPKPPKVRVASKKRAVKKKVRKKPKRDDEDDSGDLMVVMASTVAEVNVAKKREAVEKMAEQKMAHQEGDGEFVKIDSEEMDDTKVTKPKKTPAKRRKKNTGDISVMREERRDLYDLLYGDEVESKSDVGDGGYGADDNEYDGFGEGSNNIAFKNDLFSSQLDDENLDTFDPYGLEDF